MARHSVSQTRPGQRHRRQESVVARLGDHHAKQGGDRPPQSGGTRGLNRDQERLERQDEPVPSLLAMGGRRTAGLEWDRQKG